MYIFVGSLIARKLFNMKTLLMNVDIFPICSIYASVVNVRVCVCVCVCVCEGSSYHLCLATCISLSAYLVADLIKWMTSFYFSCIFSQNA